MIAFDGSINSEAVESRLDVLEGQLGDLSPSMAMIAEDYRQRVAEQFASAGAAGGTLWAALAPATLKRKRGGGGILVNSGALIDSLTDPESPDHVETIDNLSLTFGTDLPYAGFQQTGAGWGFGEATLPPAPRPSAAASPSGRGHPSAASCACHRSRPTRPIAERCRAAVRVRAGRCSLRPVRPRSGAA